MTPPRPREHDKCIAHTKTTNQRPILTSHTVHINSKGVYPGHTPCNIAAIRLSHCLYYYQAIPSKQQQGVMESHDCIKQPSKCLQYQQSLERVLVSKPLEGSLKSGSIGKPIYSGTVQPKVVSSTELAPYLKLMQTLNYKLKFISNDITSHKATTQSRSLDYCTTDMYVETNPN